MTSELRTNKAGAAWRTGKGGYQTRSGCPPTPSEGRDAFTLTFEMTFAPFKLQSNSVSFQSGGKMNERARVDELPRDGHRYCEPA